MSQRESEVRRLEQRLREVERLAEDVDVFQARTETSRDQAERLH